MTEALKPLMKTDNSARSQPVAAPECAVGEAPLSAPERHELTCLRYRVQQLEYPCSPHCDGYLREQAMQNSLREALAALDAADAACPVAHPGVRHLHLRGREYDPDRCPKCGATSSQNCGPNVSALDGLAQAVRAALSSNAPTSPCEQSEQARPAQGEPE